MFSNIKIKNQMKNNLILPTLAFFALFAAACNMSNTKMGDAEIRKQPQNAHATSNDQKTPAIDVLTRSNTALAKDIALLRATMKQTAEVKINFMPLFESIEKFNAELAAFDAIINQYLNENTNAQAIDYPAFKEQYEMLCSSLAIELNALARQSIPGVRINQIMVQNLLSASSLGGKVKELPLEKEFKQLNNTDLKLLLLTLQFNARSAYSEYIQFLLDQQKLDIKFDQFEVISASRNAAIVLGEEYETELMLNVFSRQAKFSINIDGKPTPVAEGKAIYTCRPNQIGKHNYTVEAKLSNPMTGEVYTAKQVFEYEVLSPPAFVYTAENNILYVGEAHKLNLISPAYSSENLSLSASGTAGAVLSYEEGNTYTVRAEREGTALIKITDTKTNTNISSTTYFVKAR
jgi:hypothetical protein